MARSTTRHTVQFLSTPVDSFGSATLAITADRVTKGTLGAHGASTVTETVAVASAGVLGAHGSSTRTETVTVTSDGTVTRPTVEGSATLDITVTVVTLTTPQPLDIVYSRVYGIELTLTDDGVEQVSRLVTSLDGF